MILPFACFLLLRSSHVLGARQPKIVGGVPSKGFPSFGSPDNPDCGCTLIHEDIALSAAHCEGSFIGRTIYFGGIQVDGTDAQDEAVAVEEILHEQFVYETFQNDVMLIRLGRAIQNVAPAEWNTQRDIPSDDELLDTFGFGDTHRDDGLPSDTLLEIQIPVVNAAVCNSRDFYDDDVNDETMLCAGSEGGKQDSCKGDSGNPLLNNKGLIVGVVSWGWGCGIFPGVYTRVSAFDDFIRSGICEFSASPPGSCEETRVTTAVPTAVPTAPPTADPTETPTASHTETPEADPTAAPTETPTGAPTTAPTETPTAAPTAALTETPTGAPMASPSADVVVPPKMLILTPGNSSLASKSSCNCPDYSFQSCTSCTQCGCHWCLQSAQCSPIPDNEVDAKVGCGAACSANAASDFTDPLYSAQSWVYELINVEQVWKQNITGKGVTIRINDDGVDVSHPEFSAKFDEEASCAAFLPTRDSDSGKHGTASASIASASANDECAVGIAPGATISACRVIDGPSYMTNTYIFNSEIDKVDISSNSWGDDACLYIKEKWNRRRLQECPFLAGVERSPCFACDFSNSTLTKECEDAVSNYCYSNYADDTDACDDYLRLYVRCSYNTLSQADGEALAGGIKMGRNGKGIIYVFAAGNEFGRGEPINSEGFLNSRFTITVGAVGKMGEHAPYSSTGSPLFISAPGGDSGRYETNHITAKPGGGCSDATQGTSFACPVVSGVIALMLQTNDQLGWRDVQGILQATARQTHPEDKSWTTNGAGNKHSYRFGFGLVDAYAAVVESKNWTNYGPEHRLFNYSGPVHSVITENSASTSRVTIGQLGAASFEIESVVVYLDVVHSTRGDLNIMLASPMGTESILHSGGRPENKILESGEHWQLMTVRSWGESPFGEWTLSVTDEVPGDMSDVCLDLPWADEITNDNINSACGIFEAGAEYFGVCDNGEVVVPESLILNVVDDNGVTPKDACCACGGGTQSADFVRLVKSWRLDVFGHR